MLFTSVNPHKGYLNTDFRIHTNCDHAISYMVYDKTETSVLEGIVHPNEPHSIKITSPGNYVPNLPDYTSYNLGTKFYSEEESPNDFICDKNAELYGLISIT